MASPATARGRVARRIEGYLPEDMGQCDLASLIRPRSTEPIRACGPWPRQQAGHMTANDLQIHTRQKVPASQGPSTHVLGPAKPDPGDNYCYLPLCVFC